MNCTKTLLRVSATALLLAAACPAARAADVEASWDGSFLNNWSDGARWTTTPDVSPQVPTNGASTFEVTVNLGNVIVDVPGGVAVNSLHLVDSFVSGEEPVTIVGEAVVTSTWSGATQNTEFRNPGGLTVGVGAGLRIDGSGFKSLGQPDDSDAEDDTVTLTVNGGVEFAGGGSLRGAGEGALIDVASGGLFDWASDADLAGTASSELRVTGTLTKSAGGGIASVGANWSVVNTGTIDVQSGVLALSTASNALVNDGAIGVSGAGAELRVGGGASTGTWDVAAGATLSIVSANAAIKQTLDGASSVLTNNGTVSLNGALEFNGGASLAGSGAFNLTGGSIGGDTQISVEDLSWSGGAIASTGGVVIPAGLSATLTGGADKALREGALLRVEGTVVVSGGGDIATTAPASAPATLAISAGGELDIQTDADLTDGNQLSRGGVLSNHGTLRKSGGLGTTQIESAWAIQNAGLISIESGTLQIDGGLQHSGDSAISVASGATLRLEGPVDGEQSFDGAGAVEFHDSYAPGDGPAEIAFGGDVTLSETSSLVLGLGGTDAQDYDSLTATGAIVLAGGLTVELIDPLGGEALFEPVAGDAFTLLSAGAGLSVPGGLAGVVLPATSEYAEWLLEEIDDTLQLTLVAVESGDFNADGLVDAADYTVWRSTSGSGSGVPGSLTLSDGDANGDGLVDAADYSVWQSQFGTVGASAAVNAAAVPEPAGACLMLCSMALVAVGSRRS